EPVTVAIDNVNAFRISRSAGINRIDAGTEDFAVDESAGGRFLDKKVVHVKGQGVESICAGDFDKCVFQVAAPSRRWERGGNFRPTDIQRAQGNEHRRSGGKTGP